MTEVDELLRRLGRALDDGLEAATPRAAADARVRLIDAVHAEAPPTGGRVRRHRGGWRGGSRRSGPAGRWSGLLVMGVAGGVTLAVVAVALTIGGHRARNPVQVSGTLPLGSTLNPSGPTGVIRSSVRLEAVVADPEGSGPAWGMKTYRVRGDMTCFQVGREQSGQIGAVGAYGSFGDDGRFHPFTFSDVGFGTCVPNDAHQHAFDNVAYANAPASASGEPCPAFPGRLPPRLPARIKAKLIAQAHAPACRARNQRLVAFGLLGPDATAVTYRTGHGTGTIRPHGPDGAYLIVEPVNPAICGIQCGYAGGGGATALRLPIGLIAHITYRDAPTCYGPMLTHHRLVTPQDFASCRAVGYVAPHHPRVTEADVASPVHVEPGYVRIGGGGAQLMVHISWIARQPVTNVNDSTYAIQVTTPRRCGGGGQGLGTQSLIRAGTRVTREVEVSSRCAGTYRGTVIYEQTLGPTGQGGAGLPQPGTPGTYLVGRFSITVR